MYISRIAWLTEYIYIFVASRDWTIHSSPSPAHPSYRLVTALKLLNIVDRGTTEPPPRSESDRLLERWKDVVSGVAEVVSPENEQMWRNMLTDICEQVIERARVGLDAIARVQREGAPEWIGWMRGNIRCLWQEELEVARAVAQSVKSGEEF